jgi:hypothetical protein
VATTTPATQAGADPTSQSAFVGVGADVTEDVFDALAGASPTPGAGNTTYFPPIHSSGANGGQTIESFDASPEPGTTTAPGCITTKVGGPSFDRPNSTTAGITALLAAINGTTWENSTGSCTNAGVNVTGQIDFARAARGPKTTGSTLTFIPYARDALGFLYYSNGTNALEDLTTAELQALYSNTTTGTDSIDGVTVYACLPISSSSPVTNLETVLTLSANTVEAAATAAGCNGIQQNSGNSFLTAAQATPTKDAVIPISSGSWIGQANGVGYDRSNTGRAAGVDLASITNGSSALGQPYTGSAPNEVPSTTYYQDTLYGYNIYTVVPTGDLSGFNANAGIENLFVGSSSALCSNTAPYTGAPSPQAIVKEFGFDALTSTEGTCGSTTQTGNS